jgi:hypothetical protein
MREIAHECQGFFPMQNRDVAAVAVLFKLPTNPDPPGILDAGAAPAKQSTTFACTGSPRRRS